jgi:hypothetical protein
MEGAYQMMKDLFSRGVVLAVSAVVAVVAIPAQAIAAASPATASCQSPTLSQPFLSWGDTNWYTPVPGEAVDSFTGAGWVLSGGAHVISTTLADGANGLVLDLPPGSSATSPTMCVESGEPFARMITRMTGTSASSNATTFYVTAAGSTQLGSGMPVLGKTGWAESPPDNVFPGGGAEDVYFTFRSNAKVGDLQVYDLFVDPRMCH